jgi:hypothetical protein
LLNAFITVTAESALLEAHQAESDLQRGVWRGLLHGVPVAIKDVFDTAGVRTTAASAPIQGSHPARRLLKQICVGTGQCHPNSMPFSQQPGRGITVTSVSLPLP